MPRLKTYLQVSDLHFAGTLQRLLFDPWARHVPLLPGFVGHTEPLLRYLQAAFARLVRTDPDTELIVTGDITAYGAAEQFRAADAYFGTVNKGAPFLGLNRPDWATLSVPGNHDFWPGVACVPWGWPNGEVRKRYPRDAWVTPSVYLRNGRQIVFLHLNGDADVRPFSAERLYACGSFRSAVRELRQQIAARGKDEIRVLLLHHSVQHNGSTINLSGRRWLPAHAVLTLKHLTIDDASRSELEALIADHDIRVILTGHVHHPPFVGRVTTGGLGATSRVTLEACCGTTAQRPPASGGIRSENCLVVHRIEEDRAGNVDWLSEAHVLRLGGSQGFAPCPPPAPPYSSFSVRVYP